MPEFHHSALSATFRLLSKLPPSGRASPVSIACAEDIWDRSRDGHNRRRGKHRRLCSISIEKLNIFLAKFSAEVNVDKRKTVHFFNDRSNQVVFSSVGNLYRIFSAVCSPYCLCCSISVRLSPSCRMLSGRWKSWVSGSNPGGMQSGFSPCTAHFTIRRECPATASVHLCPVPADACPPGRGNFSKNLAAFCRWRLGFTFFLPDGR